MIFDTYLLISFFTFFLYYFFVRLLFFLVGHFKIILATIFNRLQWIFFLISRLTYTKLLTWFRLIFHHWIFGVFKKRIVSFLCCPISRILSLQFISFSSDWCSRIVCFISFNLAAVTSFITLIIRLSFTLKKRSVYHCNRLGLLNRNLKSLKQFLISFLGKIKQSLLLLMLNRAIVLALDISETHKFDWLMLREDWRA